jgi:Na+-translocating ferredoxin:NAD+ oxidoreductase subunit B
MIREVAQIDEELCIGCARCLPPCPFDAILGAKKQMHTVLLEFCTGCELCLVSCPVDCIAMVARSAIPEAPVAPGARVNRERLQAHTARVIRRTAERAALLESKKQMAHVP